MFARGFQWLVTTIFIIGFFSFIVSAQIAKAEITDGHNVSDFGARTAEAAPRPTCQDTDGGNDIFKIGVLSVFTPTYGDQAVVESCVDNNNMDELVCLNNDPTYAYIHKKIECPYGCKDGACLATAPVVDTKIDLGLYGFTTIGKNRKQVKWNKTITLTPEDASSVNGDEAVFNLVFAYKNYGNAASGVFSNKVVYDGLFNGKIGSRTILQQDVRGLQAGEKQEMTTQIDLVFDKTTRSLKFFIDSNNQIEESNKPNDYANEGNNVGMVLVKFKGFDSAVSQPEIRYDQTVGPTIIDPSEGAVLTNFPRQATIRWTEIRDAARYEVEVACDYCGSSRWSSVNNWTSAVNYLITPSLAGDNQFRTRVKGLYPDGTASRWSEYVYFTYATSRDAQAAALEMPRPSLLTNEARPARRVVKKTVGRMSCGNSEGGDGLYSACKNDTIKHDSNISVKVRSYDSRNAWLSINNIGRTKATNLRVPFRKSIEVKRTDGEIILKISYTKMSKKYGVFLQLETVFDAGDDEEEEEVIMPLEAFSNNAGPTLPAYDENKPKVIFGVGVNDFPVHQDYNQSKNLANAFVNMYTVALSDNGTFKVLSYETANTGEGANPFVNFTVQSGQMVYFEGYKTEDGAKVGATKLMSYNHTLPPYKNFSSVKDKLCQTNYSKIDEFLNGTADNACATSLSTPYQD